MEADKVPESATTPGSKSKLLADQINPFQLGTVVERLLASILVDIKCATTLSMNDVLNPLDQAAQSCFDFRSREDALKMYINFEALRALRYTQVISRDETVVNRKIAKWGLRVTMLHQLSMLPYIYILKAGRRRGTKIELDISRRAATDSDIVNVIDTIVDIVSATWEAMHLINGRYDTTSAPAQLDRGILRSRQRDLWKTAAKHFQAQHNAKYQGLASISRFTETRKACTAKGPRNYPIPRTNTMTAKAQYSRYMKSFRELQQGLSNGSLLNADFHSTRRVTNCPVLLAAQKEAGRTFISSNRNAAVTGTCDHVSTLSVGIMTRMCRSWIL